MKPYQTTEECPKCQCFTDIGIEYVPPIEKGDVMIDRNYSYPECLKITCGRCGYSWNEQCADAPTGENHE